MHETYFLDMEDVLQIHFAQIARFGGADGVRDAGLIEAALQRPQAGYYIDIVEEAASLWESLTMNHGFVDGNKRVGFAVAYTFLSVNGVQLKASSDEILNVIFKNLESGTFTKDVLDAWIRKHMSTD